MSTSKLKTWPGKRPKGINMKYYMLKIKLTAPAHLNVGTFLIKCQDSDDYKALINFLQHHESYTVIEVKFNSNCDYMCSGKFLKEINI